MMHSPTLLALLLLTPSVVASEPVAKVEIAEACQEHISRDGIFTVIELPKVSGEYSETIVIGYKLDGSGKAVQPEVIQGSKRKKFDELALKVLGRAEFTPGVTADNCVYVRSFSKIRRRDS